MIRLTSNFDTMAPRYLGRCLQSLTFMLIRVTEILRENIWKQKYAPPSGWRVVEVYTGRLGEFPRFDWGR